MTKEKLINEIAIFCTQYGLVRQTVKTNELESRIEKQLEDFDFVESLINTMVVKSRYRKNVDIEKLKELLLELERIRLDLEYKDRGGNKY